MTFDDWFKYFNGDMDTVNMVYSLINYTPYTDEEIKEAIDKIGNVAIKCGVNKNQIVNMLLHNEILGIK